MPFVLEGHHMFTLNQKVVYLGHGVATISRIVQKNIAGTTASFFELKLLHKDMTALVPVESSAGTCIRTLSSDKNVTAIFALIAQSSTLGLEVTASNWSKRHKDYQSRLRTGDIYEVGKMYCELLNIAAAKGLSFGEKSLLKQIERFLAEEIAAVMNMGYDEVVESMRAAYASGHGAYVNAQQQGQVSRTL